MHMHAHARAMRAQKTCLVLLNTKMDCSRDKYILNVKIENEKRHNIHLIEKTPYVAVVIFLIIQFLKTVVGLKGFTTRPNYSWTAPYFLFWAT